LELQKIGDLLPQDKDSNSGSVDGLRNQTTLVSNQMCLEVEPDISIVNKGDVNLTKLNLYREADGDKDAETSGDEDVDHGLRRPDAEAATRR
jgi:hypothetical protein